MNLTRFGYLLSLCLCLGSCLEFVYEEYTAIVSDSLESNLTLQYVSIKPLPQLKTPTVLYSITPNDFVSINSTSGAVQYTGVPLTEDTQLELIAEIKGKRKSWANSTLHLLKISQSEQCRCFTDTHNLTTNITEEFPVSGLMFLQTSAPCNLDYTLTGVNSEKFSIQDDQITLDYGDYEQEKQLSTQVRCQGEIRTILLNLRNINDDAPHSLRGNTLTGTNERVHLIVHNLTMDPDQIKNQLGKTVSKFLIIDADNNGLTLHKFNDPLNQLMVENLTQDSNKLMLYFTQVSLGKRLTINQTTVIDVVIIDREMVKTPRNQINNFTARFILNLTNEDELESLQLEEEYERNISRSDPFGTQIWRVKHRYTEALNFSLVHSEGSPFNITPHQGILYVGQPENLSQYSGQHVSVTVNVTSGQMYKLTYIVVNIIGDPNQSISFSPALCSRMNTEVNCSATQQCMWKHVTTNTDNYRTCVPNDQCSNKECDEVEQLDKTICPQDCHTSWRVSSAQTCGHVGICRGRGYCFCQTDKYCVCVDPASLNSTEEDVDNDGIYGSGVDTPDMTSPVLKAGNEDTECGLKCMIIIICVSGVFIVLMISAIIGYYFRNEKRKKKDHAINAWRVAGGNHLRLDLTSCPEYEGSTPTTTVSMLSGISELFPYLNLGSLELYDEKWEMSREDVIIDSFIGEGEFGKVMKAKYRRPSNLDDWKLAAVKMLKDGASRTEFMDLLSEYNLLKEVDHPNVIRLVGAATLNGPFHLVVEYCEHGSLKSYLRNVRTQEPVYMNGSTQFYAQHAAELLNFTWQISKGMQYLADIKLVHRDLAARNILIATDKIVKISDFGMTKDIYEEDAYKKKGQGRIPVKWLAPESLYHQLYTSKSDVWALGVVLWEIATLGATPYPGIPPERMYQLLQGGYRMDRPETSSHTLYNLMRHCWEFEPYHRPSFKEIRHYLEHIIESQSEFLDLSTIQQQQRLQENSTSSFDEDDPNPVLFDKNLTVALLSDSEQGKPVEGYTNTPIKPHRLRYTALDIDDE